MPREPSSSDTLDDVKPQGAMPAVRRSQRSLVFATLCLLCAVLVPITWTALLDVDRQFANFGGIGVGLVACFFGFLAVAAHQRIPLSIKALVGLMPLLLVAVFFWRYEFAGFNGEVWPTFRVRAADRAESAERAKTAERANSAELGASASALEDGLETENEQVLGYRFGQLLGNDRDGRVESPEFSMDWSERLPTVVWQRDIGAGWSGFAVARGLAVTLEQRGEEEVLSAFQLTTGKTVWEHAAPGRHFHPLGGLGPRSTPTIVTLDEKLFVVAQTGVGVVMCVELETGQVAWQNDLLKIAGLSQKDSEQHVMWGRSGSPLVFNNVVVVPFGGDSKQTEQVKSLIAFDLKDGKELWRAGTSQISYASPALLTLDGKDQIVSVNEGNVTGHDPTSGRVLWSSPWPSKSNGEACASQPVAVDANHLLLGKGYAQGSKLIEVRIQADGAETDGSPQWRAEDVWANSRILKTKFTNAIVNDGKAYALSDSVLECVEPGTGVRVWRGPRFGHGQMLVVNGMILVCAEDGRIASVDSSTGKTIAEMPVLDGITWNVPTVAGPYLLVRNGTQAACLISPADPH